MRVENKCEGVTNEESSIKNENEKKKNYLRQYRKHKRKINRIEAEIEEIRSMKMYPSMNNNGMPHGYGQRDMSDYAVELLKKEDKVYQEGIEQVKIYNDISFRINQLEDENEKDVLFYRYIKGYEWWEVAKAMGYSERRIYEIHGDALKKLKIP